MRQLEESPTRASTRATTRIAMRTKISDRVQQSQEGYQAPQSNVETQEIPNKALSSPHAQDLKGVTDEGSSGVGTTSRSALFPRYGIETLIELGSKVQDVSQILLKIKPEAIAENLFQYMGIDRAHRPTARSRGLSDVTNLSRRSVISNTGVNEWEPTRQPRPAPYTSDSKHTSFLQQHEGFIRFLKQHASPPHHGVTAGGRIVPTGPLSPPPMFDYASLNGLLEGQPGKAQAPGEARINRQNHHGSETGLGSTHFKARSTNPRIQGNQISASQPINPGMHYSPQPLMNPIIQPVPPSLALTPLGVFPDGTSLIFCNGVCYRCFWNGITTVMEPLTTSQPLLAPNEAGLNDLTMPIDKNLYASGLYGNVAPSTLSLPAEVPFKGASIRPNSAISQPLTAAVKNASHSEENSLKAQLTSLDKYMALHHFEIGPPEKTQLVSRRKTLVEAIAKIRSDREPSLQTMPIVAPSMDTNRKSSFQSATNHIFTETKQRGRDKSVSGNTNKKMSFKKCLSPSAPAFIPKSMGASFAPDSPALVPMPKNTPELATVEPSGVIKTPSGNNLDEVANGENRKREVSSSSEDKPYIEVDPWDPAMKIVPPSMTLYAQKYNPSSSDGVKKFCTTVEEFQEAIRRVREQARMWGCVGGNSKDPAYDAEEDIWYAIKDECPIPLPTATPDHIASPRPWNWYDSAFNVNASIEPKINMRGHTLEGISDQQRKAGFGKSSSVNIFATQDRIVGARKSNSDFENSNTSLDRLARGERHVSVQGSGTFFGQYENRQQWQKPNAQLIKNKDDFQKAAESSKANGNYKDDQNKYNQSLPQPEQVSIRHFSNAPRAQDQAIQAAGDLTNAKSRHSCVIDSCPKTPLSSPNRANSKTFVEGLPTHDIVMPLDQGGKMRQNALNASVQQIPTSTLHELAETKTLTWDGSLLSESRVAWGPEQFPFALKNDDAPEVKIPEHKASYVSSQVDVTYNAQNSQKSPSIAQAPSDRGVNLEDYASPSGSCKKTFLKEMLKDPRYSVDDQHSYFMRMKPRGPMMDRAMAQQVAQSEREFCFAEELMARAQQGQQKTDKENITTETFRRHDEDASMMVDGIANFSNSITRISPTSEMPASSSTKKATTSIANPTYHARGILPSYDGAGKAQAASIYRQRPHRASQNKLRVHLLLSSSHIETGDSNNQSNQHTTPDNSTHGTNSHYIPIMFGYDGNEEPATDSKSGMNKDKSGEKGKGSSDRKEVTLADFDKHRPDHDNEWHRGAVNDFFRDLHEKEVKYMMSRQRKNTKTVP